MPNYHLHLFRDQLDRLLEIETDWDDRFVPQVNVTKKQSDPNLKLVWTKHPDGTYTAGPLPKHYWRNREIVPPWTLEAFARKAEKLRMPVVARLLRLYSYRCCAIEYLATREDWLEEVGLDITDVHPGDIVKAQRMLRESEIAFQSIVEQYWPTRKIAEIYDEAHKPESKREKMFNYPITAVLRWMGLEGWTFDEAKTAMEGYGVDVADATIRAQLRAGKLGERGEPAQLNEDQINSLYEYLE